MSHLFSPGSSDLGAARSHARSGGDDTRVIEVTRIENAGKAPLTKSFDLREGMLHKVTSAKLVLGSAHRMGVACIQEFGDLLASLEPHEALTYGVADNRDSEIVTDAALRNKPGAISRTRKYFSFRPAPSIMLLDHDPAPDASPVTAEQLRNSLIEACPELAAAPMAALGSASSFIYDCERELRGAGGWHLYVVVADGSDIERAGNALYEHCWRAGIYSECPGYYKVSKSGQLLDRNLIDASVWQPERLDFAAGALCIEPVVQRRPLVQFWNPAAPPFDTRRIANLTPEQAEIVSKHRAVAREAVKDERTIIRAKYRSERIAELCARGLDDARAGEIIDQALDHKALLGDFELTISSGERITVAEVLANKTKFHSTRFADPMEPEYGNDGRIAYANLYGGGRPYIYSHAHGGRRFELYPQPRTLQLQRGELPRLADRAIELMSLGGDLYDRPIGNGRYSLVYVREGFIIPSDEPWLRDYLGRLVKCERFDKRSKTWESADVPPELVKAILGRTSDRNLPKLKAVIVDPVMRLDGSILDSPGYSAQDGLLFVSDEIEPPRVPLEPTDEQVRTAFKSIWRAFAEFPFADTASRGVMLAALVTAVMRPMVPTAPAFAFDAPKAGSGKSLLAECICAVCGIPPPVNPPPRDDDEAAKTLFSALRNGARVVLWDNFTQPVYGNSAICAFLTASQFSQRVLGHSEYETLPNGAMLLLTGNNLRVQGDACRRVLVCRIDAGTEHPETRSFPLAPAQHLRQNRTEIRTAILTLLRSFHSRGAPKQTDDTVGSFEDWDALVRQLVVWLGHSDLTGGVQLSDPFETARANIDNDLNADSLGGFMHAWREVFGDGHRTAAQALNEVQLATTSAIDGLREAIDAVEEDRPLTPKRFARWLQKHRDQPVDGLRIVALRDSRTKNFAYAVVPLVEEVPPNRKSAELAQLDPLLQ